MINKYSELSLEELLNLLPPSLELPFLDNHKETGRAFLIISKFDETCEPFVIESKEVKKMLGGNGAWNIGYLYMNFENSIICPYRIPGTLEPLDLEDLANLDDSAYLSSGILSTDLKDAIIKLINWLNENNICQV